MRTRDRIAASMLVAALMGVAPCAAATEPAATPVTLRPGTYAGSLTVTGVSPCEQYVSGVDQRTHIWKTDAFLTVDAKGATLLLEYAKSNTKAADYFESKNGTLVLTPGHMVGGKRHQSYYYFDMPLRKDQTGGGYTAKGDWIIQDACESEAPRYDATLKFKMSRSH
jgi:hypothetical protein